MDPDFNKYDVHHRVVHHPKMSDAEFDQTYRDAWKTYYTPEHIETVSRRHGATPGRNPAEPARFMTMFKIMFEAEGIHPLEGGIVRLKYRRDRRYGRRDNFRIAVRPSGDHIVCAPAAVLRHHSPDTVSVQLMTFVVARALT